MPTPLEPRFSWRGVVLIAISFALIGLAVFFRGHDASRGFVVSVPTASEWKLLATALGISVLLVLAAFLGSWCGYLRVAFRLRKLQKSHDHTAATPKT
jgi:zinc transporter ZupT